jgi:hypothetical protein
MIYFPADVKRSFSHSSQPSLLGLRLGDVPFRSGRIEFRISMPRVSILLGFRPLSVACGIRQARQGISFLLPLNFGQKTNQHSKEAKKSHFTEFLAFS